MSCQCARSVATTSRAVKRGYFVYVNAEKSRDGFDGRLEFSEQIIPHDGDDTWVHGAVVNAHRCHMDASPPASAEECEWCAYRRQFVSRATIKKPRRFLTPPGMPPQRRASPLRRDWHRARH